jgi:hypothetical protein
MAFLCAPAASLGDPLTAVSYYGAGGDDDLRQNGLSAPWKSALRPLRQVRYPPDVPITPLLPLVPGFPALNKCQRRLVELGLKAEGQINAHPSVELRQRADKCLLVGLEDAS